ncbi:MAG TPA: helix-turn-helix transcriptional regulator [Pseudonocardiaceae bacterium]|nr:helix-turn-helix transcriptional regulator [Pseudonocardiaceae bacterium]
MVSAPEPVERDSRGILDPGLLRQRVRLTRYPVDDELAGLVDRFWVVHWDLPAGAEHRQQVLTHPAANLSVTLVDGRLAAQCNGVARAVTTRVLTGQGWAVAAMTTPGGLGAFVTDASEYTDRVVPLGVIGVDGDALCTAMGESDDEAQRVAQLDRALRTAVRPDRVAAARQVADVAKVAETDRSVRRLADLAQRSGVTPRSVQRMFLRYAGVSPTWVLRRYRLIDAAEAVRGGEQVVWAELAERLGYADQAHLIRDFRAAIGQTPAAYGQSQARHGL